MENLTSGSGSGESCLVGRQNGLGQRILTYLHTHGSADRRELLPECFARHVSASRLDEALDALLSWAPPRITVEVGV